MRWRRRLDVLLRKTRVEDELDEELRAHLEFEIEDLMKTGLDRAEARRRALVAFGGVERFKEEVRDVRGMRLMDDLVQDIRVAARSLAKQPVFLVATILTLALGIGGNVAMFGVLDATLFGSLPYPDADELVTGRSTFNDGESLGPVLAGTDLMDYADSRALGEAAAIMPFVSRVTIDAGDGADRADLVWVSTDFFEVLGVAPVVGRGFAADEGERGAPNVVLLSQAFWNGRFGGDPSVVGSTLVLNGSPHTVVGVMPASARFMVDADLWIPLVALRDRGRNAHNYLLVGRLNDGTSLAAAQAELDAISARLQEAYPETNDGKGILLSPTRSVLTEDYRAVIGLLGASLLLLLVVACANVAGLLTARGAGRAREVAVRSALGAGRGRITRQLLTESALLAVAAGVLGIAVASVGQRLILRFVSFDRLGQVQPGIDLGTVAFALGLSLATVLLFGVLPAVRSSRVEASKVLRASGGTSGGTGSATLRRWLVTVQVVVTVVLVSVAGLMVRSFEALDRVDLGFRADALLTADLELPASEYSAEERVAFYEELRARMLDTPGVTEVGLASRLPIRRPGNNWGVRLPSQGGGSQAPSVLAHQRTVMPGYFSAMEIPLLAGRDVEPSDRDLEPAALVISQRTAERLFGAEDPIGRFVETDGRGGEPPMLHQVVGVVGDVHMDDASSLANPAMYYAYHSRTPTRMTLAIRTSAAPEAVASSLRETVRSMSSSLALDGVETMESILSRRSSGRRALTLLVGTFSALATILAAVGLYGMMAYLVSRRLREIGIRMALGSTRSRVSNAVLREGLGLVGRGVLIGIPLAIVSGRLAEGFLFGVQPVDPLTFVGVLGLLTTVTVVSCLLPARRAAAIDPKEALRAE